MKVYVTKYALTEGIILFEARPGFSDGMIAVKPEGAMFDQYFRGKDWHEDIESAVSRAEEMRRKKITALEKNIDKLVKMDFNEIKDRS